MKRAIIDYKKLTDELLNLLVDKFPYGYSREDIIRFKNIHGEIVEAVEIRTEDTVYLVKVSKGLANSIENFDDDDDDDADVDDSIDTNTDSDFEDAFDDDTDDPEF